MGTYVQDPDGLLSTCLRNRGSGSQDSLLPSQVLSLAETDVCAISSTFPHYQLIPAWVKMDVCNIHLLPGPYKGIPQELMDGLPLPNL